jgi:polar amino acid transport system permease protein
MVAQLLPGALVTVEITAVAALLALVAAVVAGIGRISEHRLIRWVAGAYVEVFRGTSVLVQLFWLFFALPGLGIRLSPFMVAVLGLGLNVGAYGSEVVRGAILAVPRAQTDAAIALNMTRRQRLLRVILPQAAVAMLPPFGNLLIQLLKGTSLVSLITISELTFEGQQIRSLTGQSGPVFALILVFYFLLAYPIIRLVRLCETRVSRGMDIGPHAMATP